MSNDAQAQGPDRVRKTIRLHPDTAMQAEYWRKRHGMGDSEYYEKAVEEKIARENGHYDLPTLEQQRLNQLIDEIRALSTNVANLETVTASGFDSLLGLTRGDNYLLDDETGELAGLDDHASSLVE